jgi:hypothetical protein
MWGDTKSETNENSWHLCRCFQQTHNNYENTICENVIPSSRWIVSPLTTLALHRSVVAVRTGCQACWTNTLWVHCSYLRRHSHELRCLNKHTPGPWAEHIQTIAAPSSLHAAQKHFLMNLRPAGGELINWNEKCKHFKSGSNSPLTVRDAQHRSWSNHYLHLTYHTHSIVARLNTYKSCCLVCKWVINCGCWYLLFVSAAFLWLYCKCQTCVTRVWWSAISCVLHTDITSVSNMDQAPQ